MHCTPAGFSKSGTRMTRQHRVHPSQLRAADTCPALALDAVGGDERRPCRGLSAPLSQDLSVRTCQSGPAGPVGQAGQPGHVKPGRRARAMRAGVSERWSAGLSPTSDKPRQWAANNHDHEAEPCTLSNLSVRTSGLMTAADGELPHSAGVIGGMSTLITAISTTSITRTIRIQMIRRIFFAPMASSHCFILLSIADRI